MRRLSKPWPPADVSPSGQGSRSFQEAEREFCNALPGKSDPISFARSQFDRLEKSKLREVFYREQHSLCIFCESPIQEGKPIPRIDHWRPLEQNPDLALHWKNLHLSCASAETCDIAKRSCPLKWEAADPDLPWPTEFEYEKHLGFTSLGEMYVRNDTNLEDTTRKALQLAIADQIDGTQTKPAILNLNHPALVAARAAALDSERTRLEKTFKNKTATQKARQKAREQHALNLLNEEPRKPFVSIRLSWLRKAVGKGR